MLPEDFQPHYLRVSERDGVVIVEFVLTQLTDDENIEILGRELFALIDHYNFLKVIANMNGVQYITSSVLGKIITLHRKLNRGDGRLVLCELEQGVLDTLETSRLINYFTTANSVDAALAIINAS